MINALGCLKVSFCGDSLAATHHVATNVSKKRFSVDQWSIFEDMSHVETKIGRCLGLIDDHAHANELVGRV